MTYFIHLMVSYHLDKTDSFSFFLQLTVISPSITSLVIIPSRGLKRLQRRRTGGGLMAGVTWDLSGWREMFHNFMSLSGCCISRCELRRQQRRGAPSRRAGGVQLIISQITPCYSGFMQTTATDSKQYSCINLTPKSGGFTSRIWDLGPENSAIQMHGKVTVWLHVASFVSFYFILYFIFYAMLL